MNLRGGRPLSALALGVVLSAVLTACSSGPSSSEKSAVKSILTTTTTTTTTTTSPAPPSSTSTTEPGTVVPDVIGQKLLDARATLRAAGFRPVNINRPCNKGTEASQSVVSSLDVPGKPPAFGVGAVPLTPGTALPPRSAVGIVWSACYGNGSVVPDVVGMKFAAARKALAQAGLTWSCVAVGPPTTTNASTTSTTLPASNTKTKPTNDVLSQDPAAATVLKPGATVTVTMQTCPP